MTQVRGPFAPIREENADTDIGVGQFRFGQYRFGAFRPFLPRPSPVPASTHFRAVIWMAHGSSAFDDVAEIETLTQKEAVILLQGLKRGFPGYRIGWSPLGARVDAVVEV